MSSDGPPADYVHTKLGKFLRDANGDYRRLLTVRRQRYALILNVGHLSNSEVSGALDRSAEIFIKFFSDTPGRLSQCNQAISEKFLTIANEYAEQAQRKPMTESAFLRRIRLKNITVHPEGCSYWFEDGYCLGGHGIVVSFGPRGGLTEEPWLVG